MLSQTEYLGMYPCALGSNHPASGFLTFPLQLGLFDLLRKKLPVQWYEKEKRIDLGNFSVSLAVKDIAASQAFYEKLGFTIFAGDQAQNWLIMKNGDHLIGLFQGMFDKNVLTFNPGWGSDGEELNQFTDIREIQLKTAGVNFVSEADERASGPASFSGLDPDGNPILVDQHR